MTPSYTQVQDLLPHRHPFLFINKITSLEPGRRIEGIFRVKTDHPFINHLGQNPVFPASLVVEALGQVAALCIRYPQKESLPQLGSQGFLVRIDECSFLQPIQVERDLLLTADLVKQFSTLYKFQVKGFVNEQAVVKAFLTLFLEI